MWSFEGEYKRRPKQSLGGASRSVDKVLLLSKLKSDRVEREECRRREAAAIRIQAWVRGYNTRLKVHQHLRSECDALLAKAKSFGLSKDLTEGIISLLSRFFQPCEDQERLLILSRHIIKHTTYLFEWIETSTDRWQYLLGSLLTMALSIVNIPVKDSKSMGQPYAIPLRLLEICLSRERWKKEGFLIKHTQFLAFVFRVLLRRGYYKHLTELLVSKMPVIYAPSPTPVTPLAESVFALMLHPLEVFNMASKEDRVVLNNLLLMELFSEILCKPFHSQIRNFVLPALVSSTVMTPELIEGVVRFVYDNVFQSGQQKMTPVVLLPLLTIIRPSIEFQNCSSLGKLLRTISHFLEHLVRVLQKSNVYSNEDFSSDTEEEEEEENNVDMMDSHVQEAASLCLEDLNSHERVLWLLSQLESNLANPTIVIYFCQLFYLILSALKFQQHKCRLLYSVVSRRHVLRCMWKVLSGLRQGVDFSSLPTLESLASCPSGYDTPLLVVLARGTPLSPRERDTLLPLLAAFSATLMALLSTLHDTEFLGDKDLTEGNHIRVSQPKPFPFTVDEVIWMSAMLRDVCVGLSELAYPDMRMSAFFDPAYKTLWLHCFKACIGVLRQIHLRDTRRTFCPESFWLSSRVSLPPLSSQQSVPFTLHHRKFSKLFERPKWRTKDEIESGAGSSVLSLAEERRATLLHELPFVFPFETRMGIFSKLIATQRYQNQQHAQFNIGPFIDITIRRTHIYEDAFEKLSLANEPNLCLKMRVHLMNAVGLDEAGIDGGGIFREFLSELLKTAFDPTRGFFLMTRDNTYYPNPSAHLIAEDFEQHYFFIGRMVGKALSENLLVEIPLAGFFLSKLLNTSSSVEFHYLDSLDPELCKNLLYLKTYAGDVEDLGLDFTVLNSELGQNKQEELIPNGSDTPVTRENLIEYIYRMADFKLNKQIAKQCQAFREGLFNVIDASWLKLFDWRELQMLLSGSSTPIDIQDLRANTRYGGVYHEDHPTIEAFWRVLSKFDLAQRRKLLKFVTSCSRPPLQGFKELHPPFCIQPSGSDDRLPTVSTCMNLLKLPEYKDENTLFEKLSYAINASAGFELS